MQSTHPVHRPDRSTAVPESVDSKGGKLVYVYLSFVVEATVPELADALDLKHINLLPVLASLQQAGHVERDGDICRVAR